MRILQIHAGYRLAAGEDTVVANEASALRRGGHDVDQFIVPNPTGTRDALAALARSAHNRSTGRAVAELIRRDRPDVVHVHNTWFAVSPSVIDAARAAGVPVVMTVHNYRLGCLGTDLFRDGAVCTACVGRSPWSGVVHACYRGSRALSAIQAVEIGVTRRRRTVADGVTTFVAPSGFMADRLVDIGVPAERLVVKPHFTDDPGPRPAPPSASDELVFVGRLAPGKGLETMLAAWGQRSPDRAPRELVVVGDGPSAAALRASASSGVTFRGWLGRAEVTALLLRARALVFPSEWYEPFGMVLIEALSAGLPIVTTNAAAAAEISAAPPTLVVPTGRPELLAAALDSLTDGAVDRVGNGSRRRFEDHFSERAGLSALEHVYRSAIAAGSTAPVPDVGRDDG